MRYGKVNPYNMVRNKKNLTMISIYKLCSDSRIVKRSVVTLQI